MVACVWLAATPAAHAEPSVSDKATARELLLDGRAKMAAKEYAAALKAFQGAHAIMNVPTTGLDLARAQAALGQLVEARESALAVTRLPGSADEPEAFADARKAADELATSLAPRIPSVVITLKGPGVEGATVTLNGTALPAATLGLPRKVNPGRHRIAAAAPGFAESAREVDVAEGQSLPIDLALERGAATAVPAVTAPPAATATVVPVTSSATVVPVMPSPAASGDGAARRPPAWAWAAGGAGLVALGVGVGFFVDHLGVRDRVAAECPGNVCDPGKHDADSAQGLRSQWNRDLGLAVAMGALGLAGVGVAIAGFVGAAPAASHAGARDVRPSHARDVRPSRPRVMLRAGPGGLSVEGAF